MAKKGKGTTTVEAWTGVIKRGDKKKGVKKAPSRKGAKRGVRKKAARKK